MNKSDFCKDALNAAVVRQLGGWTSFKESAGDITDHGIDGGFHGFIYYMDTVPFGKRNREAIKRALKEDAESMGEPLLKMVASFRCLDDQCQEEEIAECLYGSGCADENAATQIYNALAWYAGETVARRYVDAIEAE